MKSNLLAVVNESKKEIYTMIHKNNAIPWHLIGQLASRGESVQSLSRKFNVSEKRIKNRLALALADNGRVRSNLEIKEAANQVKSDLVGVLLKLSRNLASRDEPQQKDSAELAKLIDSASKLFSWPNAKPVDVTALLNAQTITPAINLALIRTTPEQLRAKAKEIEDDQPNSSLAS